MNDGLRKNLVRKKDGEFYNQEQVEELQKKASRVEELEKLVEKAAGFKEKYAKLDDKYTILVSFTNLIHFFRNRNTKFWRSR